jgi:hypothetical protein
MRIQALGSLLKLCMYTTPLKKVTTGFELWRKSKSQAHIHITYAEQQIQKAHQRFSNLDRLWKALSTKEKTEILV